MPEPCSGTEPGGRQEGPEPRFTGCTVCLKRDGVFTQDVGPDGSPRWVCRDDPVGCLRRRFDFEDFLAAHLAAPDPSTRTR